MGGCYKHYSVYEGEDEIPLVIYGTVKECASAMGVKPHTIYEYACRMKRNKFKLKRWLVCLDEEEENEDV